MKRLIALALVLGSGLSLWGQTIHLTWATNPAYPPYDWSLHGKRYHGAAEKLIAHLRLPGVDFVPVFVPWKRAQEMAKDGQLDLLVNIRDTPQREIWLDFAQTPAFSNPIVIFMRREDQLKPGWQWDELIPLHGGQAAGDSFGSPFDEFLKQHLTMQTAPTVVQNFKKLLWRRIDFYVTSLYLGKLWLAKSGNSRYVGVLLPPVSEQAITIAFSKRSRNVKLLAELDARLAELRQKGVLDQIFAQAMTEAQQTDFSSLTRP